MTEFLILRLTTSDDAGRYCVTLTDATGTTLAAHGDPSFANALRFDAPQQVK